MSFESILYLGTNSGGELLEDSPECFADLGLDLIVTSIVTRRENFGLDRLWYSPLVRVEDARYRQEVFTDLEDPSVLGSVREFSEALNDVLVSVQEVERWASGPQLEGIFVGAVLSYCKAVLKLFDSLLKSTINSAGLVGFREYLNGYVSSKEFLRLNTEAEEISSEIASLNFYMDIKGSTVTVYGKAEDDDYSAFIEKLFSRFRPSNDDANGVAEPKWRLTHIRGHVEEAILDLAARLYREPFGRLSRFYAKNKDFADRVVLRFYREIQFYLSYLDYISVLKEADLPFCVPKLIQEKGEVYCQESFDLALASKVAREGRVVPNDFKLDSQERVIVVTGPNSGGKTTFARMIGQLHYLARLGVPVPGRRAALLFVDGVYTHFPRAEDVENMRGKLEEDLVRIKRVLDKATARSVIVVNEMFGSTSTFDAALLGRKIIERVRQIGSLCVYVTFVDELASLEHVASYVAQVDPQDLETRTFKVVRQRADGLAYARLIAKKYHLTYEDIVSRVNP